jgi:hypothetical protein
MFAPEASDAPVRFVRNAKPEVEEHSSSGTNNEQTGQLDYH